MIKNKRDVDFYRRSPDVTLDRLIGQRNYLLRTVNYWYSRLGYASAQEMIDASDPDHVNHGTLAPVQVQLQNLHQDPQSIDQLALVQHVLYDSACVYCHNVNTHPDSFDYLAAIEASEDLWIHPGKEAFYPDPLSVIVVAPLFCKANHLRRLIRRALS